MLFPFLSLTDDEARRRALQAKYFADLVVKIPLVAIVEQILAIDKADEGWRASGSLRHIINFQPPALSVGGCTLAVAAASTSLSLPVEIRMAFCPST